MLNERLKDQINIGEREYIETMGTDEIKSKAKEAAGYVEADIAAMTTEKNIMENEIDQMTAYVNENRNVKGNVCLISQIFSKNWHF